MKVSLKSLIFLLLVLSATISHAQNPNEERIKTLENLKEVIQKEEKDHLKAEVEAINNRLEKGELSQEEADNLKKESAEKHALNIENRIKIVENKIELLKRNEEGYDANSDGELGYVGFSIGGSESYAGFKIPGKKTPRKYDRRTSTDVVLALGINNAISEGEGLGDTPFKLFGSGFIELGWVWNTRVLKNSNFWRFRYGLSAQWNKLEAKDDMYFVQNGDVTTFEEFPSDLRKSKFRVTNLVVPVHFEFGPSKKIDRKTYIRYSTSDQFKIGFGGYGGIRLSTMQKLKYKEDGNRVKDKIKRNYNTSNFVYGLSAYVGIDDFSLYAKYDLSTLFKDQAIDQNNISIGLRFDID